VTFKDPKALEIALFLSVWPCASIALTCLFSGYFGCGAYRIRVLNDVVCGGLPL
jgi:hypothetical protein